jgi:hypothetical protein
VLEKLRFASPSLHSRGFAYASLFKPLVPVLSAFTTLVGKEKKICNISTFGREMRCFFIN